MRKINIKFEIVFNLASPSMNWSEEIKAKMEKLGFEVSIPGGYNNDSPFVAIYPKSKVDKPLQILETHQEIKP